MKKVFDEVNSLDKKCYEKYHLSEDILMEHAALGMFNHINSKTKQNKNILIICGNGNNGADGIVLARLLHKLHNVTLFMSAKTKSTIAKLQKKRTLSLGIKEITTINGILSTDILVDCLYGTGLNRQLDLDSIDIINKMNEINAYKISCDVPSGVNAKGQILSCVFKADATITMGALKKSLYSDTSKDYVGDIIVSDLGLAPDMYEGKSDCFLLEKKDLKLPNRNFKNTNKSSFGHLSVLLGNKIGAGIIACETALSFGSGLVTAITKNNDIPYSIMYSDKLPLKTTAIALGMGLGSDFDKDILDTNINMLLDADILYDDIILNVLERNNIVLTPHPKEFCSVLKICNIANIDIVTLQNNRFDYVDMFCKKYPNVVLLLKGANTIIQQNNKTYINQLGTPKLSFAGSGDILAGLISSMLAQNYEPLEACIQGTLSHTIAAINFKGNDYSLNPKDLIDEIKILK